MSVTVGEVGRNWRCRPRRTTESTPAAVSLARWALAVWGVIRAAAATSLAVRGRPSQCRHHGRSRRISDQRRDLGDHGAGNHSRYLPRIGWPDAAASASTVAYVAATK